ncbi:MAG: SCO family protein [Acidimicrobiales bacterium]|nr:SCO family protein [Acidimicrobiales bacterium]
MRHIARSLFAVLVLAAVAAGCASSKSGPPAANVGTIIPPGHPVPDTSLVDQNGQASSLASFKGRYVVLAQFLTLCQEECPLTTAAFQNMKAAVDKSGLSSKVAFVEVTVDPERDNPARLLAYQKEFGADWTLLTGTTADISAFWKAFGVFYQKVPEGSPPADDWLTHQPLTYDIDHSNGFVLIDPSGDERFITQELPNLHGQLSPQLKSLLDSEGISNLDSADPGQSYTIPQALGALSWLVGKKLPVPTG